MATVVNHRSLRAEQQSTAFASQGEPNRWVIGLPALSILLGLIEAWLNRQDMYSDGVSYLDVGERFFGPDWHSAINAYWSPLYPLLLGAFETVFKPSVRWEFPLVHLLNFLVYVGCLASFHFLLISLMDYVDRFRGGLPASVPRWAWMAIGYALFTWSSLRLITISVVSPDMCVATAIYLATGCLLRIESSRGAPVYFLLLGLACGLGYLAKAPMLPLSAAFFVISAIQAYSLGAKWWAPGLVVSAFLLTAGPFIMQLSLAKGELTFGDSAKLNAAWYINQVPRYHWRGGKGLLGTPVHPTDQLTTEPPAYAFSGNGTYPVWFDPSYWHQGIKPKLDVKAVVKQTLLNGLVYYDVFFRSLGAALVVLFALSFLNGFAVLRGLRRFWTVLVPTLIAFGMYVVVHVETRMIAAQTVILLLAWFAAIRSDAQMETQRWTTAAVLSLSAFLFVTTIASTFGQMASSSPRELRTAMGREGYLQEVVVGLRGLGLKPGDKVAWIRPHPFTRTQHYWWAKLAGLQIVAEVPAGQEAAFWSAPVAAQHEVVNGMSRTGAKFLIATHIPPGSPQAGWIPIGSVGYYAFPLAVQATSQRN